LISDTDKIYAEWVSSVDLAKTRLARIPSFIFLCGGPVSGNGKKFKSCRDIFHWYVNHNKCSFRGNVILAEQVFRYFEHTAYTDLLCFERDLAELSALTIIFSESPGSVAELGSFAVLENIQDKLLVVLHQNDSHKESFIWRGPILYLREHAKKKKRTVDPITIYNWRRKTKKGARYSEKDFSDAEDLSEAVETILNKLPKTETFNKDKTGHIMLLLLDILKIIQLATIDDLVSLLVELGIHQARNEVKQHMSLLMSLDLAVMKPYRHNEYYFPGLQEHWLTWAYKNTATNRDLERWKGRFIDFYNEEHKQKYRALRSYLKSSGQIGD
jgi:hypothetical protein